MFQLRVKFICIEYEKSVFVFLFRKDYLSECGRMHLASIILFSVETDHF